MTNRRLAPTLAILVTMVGCNHVRIQEPELVGPAAALGDASAELVSLPADAQWGELKTHTDAVEAALLDLAVAHDDWATVGTHVVPRQHPLRTVDPKVTEGLMWDGTQLTGADVDADGRAVLDLRFTGERTIDVGPNVLHENACGVTLDERGGGGGNVTCPALVDQGLAASYTNDGGVLELSATYRLNLDGNDCASGGGIDVTYRVTPEEGAARDGFVSATFHGCGTVQVFGRE